MCVCVCGGGGGGRGVTGYNKMGLNMGVCGGGGGRGAIGPSIKYSSYLFTAVLAVFDQSWI